ncbi:MAG: hypothetical protein IJV33_08860 [Bacteroidaceae bacterium]|nr:hypothetical protein [Bacteroidaceae bacterium]
MTMPQAATNGNECRRWGDEGCCFDAAWRGACEAPIRLYSSPFYGIEKNIRHIRQIRC